MTKQWDLGPATFKIQIKRIVFKNPFTIEVITIGLIEEYEILKA